MLKEFISKEYLSNSKIKKLYREFNLNKPFPHLILKNFFDKRKIREFAIELVKNEEFEFKESDLFSFAQTKDLVSSKNYTVKSFYDLINSEKFKEFLDKVTGITALGKIDCSGFIYANTDHLLPHDDRLDKRKIAYTLNLSEEFTTKDGGFLEFFDNDQIVKKIMPMFNTFVIFKVITNKTYHQVSEVTSNKKRLSVSGWYNDK